MIGLATPFLTNNYGTKLQAFALQRFLDLNGYENEIIRYTFQEKVINPKKLLLSNRKKYKAVQKARHHALSINASYKQGIQARNERFKEFTEKHYRFSKQIDTLAEANQQAKQYSAVICGSDQIWLPSHILEKYYTLEFVPKGVKRISYAPSFGVSEVPRYLKREYRTALEKFDTLTVREIRGAEIIMQLTSKQCPVVADPTLLLSKAEWEAAFPSKEPFIKEKYVFAYFIGENEKHRRVASNYAKANGCKLVILPNIGGLVSWDEQYADIAPYGVAPDDFVNLVRNAECIFTDSFHGSVFSLIFQRNLYVFERFKNDNINSTNSRIYSLLHIAGIENRMITESEGWKINTNIIDYSDVASRLNELRRKSHSILLEAIDK